MLLLSPAGEGGDNIGLERETASEGKLESRVGCAEAMVEAVRQ